MSKSFYFASEEELQEFLYDFVKTRRDVCQTIFFQCEDIIKQGLKELLLNELETANFQSMKTYKLFMNGALIFNPNAIVGLEGTPTSEAFLRFDPITNKSLSYINKLNVDELYIHGKKLNIVQNTSQTLQLEENPSWN